MPESNAPVPADCPPTPPPALLPPGVSSPSVRAAGPTGGGDPSRSGWNFTAALAAWLLPGLGHLLLRQSGRGVILGITVGTLWLAGLLIGGISVVDRTDHPAWFLGQMLIAPSFAADLYRGKLVREHEGRFVPEDDPPFEPAYGRAHEQGTLFTSLAGLFNLLAIIDILYRQE